MGPGFKYHVATIAAIFFALTVGLVVGSLTVSPHLVNTYKGALKGLQSTLNTDINEKSVQIAHYQKLLDQVMPLALSHKLKGQGVAVIQLGDSSSALQAVQTALAMSNAKEIETFTVSSSLDVPDDQLQVTLNNLTQDGDVLPGSRNTIVSAIAHGVINGGNPSDGVIAELDKAGILHIENDSYLGKPLHDIVIIGGSRGDHPDRFSQVDMPLILAFQSLGAHVVMCESLNARVSDIQQYEDAGVDIATIDDIDTRMGQFSLVYSLLGEKDDYGVKPTAHALMPSIIPDISTVGTR